jgi:ABC-type branched-subunit amino acid transport system ATPase component
MMAAALVAEHLDKTFPGVRAVADVSFEVRAGEIVGLDHPRREQRRPREPGDLP